MRLALLLDAGPVVVTHALLAFAAIGVGSVQFAMRKGSYRHRVAGYVWVGLLAFVALSSFGIHGLRQVGPFSWIHAVSVLTLVALVGGIVRARTGRIEAHRWTMIGLFVGALLITGMFTLVPGRLMHTVLFGT